LPPCTSKADGRFAGLIKEVRGQGLLLGLELHASGVGTFPTAGEVVGSATQEGLLLVPAGPKVVRFVPPLVVTAAEVDAALAAFEKALLKHVKA
jgi:acetylornithine aminotransferase